MINATESSLPMTGSLDTVVQVVITLSRAEFRGILCVIMDAVIECGVARALSASTIMFGGMKATAFVFGGVYASKKADTAG